MSMMKTDNPIQILSFQVPKIYTSLILALNTNMQFQHGNLNCHHYLPSAVTSAAPRSQASQTVKKAAPDGVFNYASAVLNDGLLLLEYKDAIREGDGERILRC